MGSGEAVEPNRGSDAVARSGSAHGVPAALAPRGRKVAGCLALPAVEALPRGKKTPLGDEEAIGGDAQRPMMMEAAPAPALIGIEPDFLFQFLVIALTPSSAFSGGHQIRDPPVRWQRAPAV